MQTKPANKAIVLEHLAKSVPLGEAVVCIGGSVDQSVERTGDGETIGMLHLGPGCYQQFENLQALLVKGAIVTFEDCYADGPAYNYAIDLAARGFLSSPVEARHWDGLGVTTYLGKSK